MSSSNSISIGGSFGISYSYGTRATPLKNGCFKASLIVILFRGSNVIKHFKKSTATLFDSSYCASKNS